jgi:nitrogen fixation protein FixH
MTKSERNPNPEFPTSRSYWPLGITLAFILFALGIATMVVIACTQKVDLVRPDYYDQEIKYQTQLDRLNRTLPLNESVRIAYDKASRQLTLSLPPAHATPDTVGRIELYRPSATDLDHQLKLSLDANGTQTVDASSLIPGLWKVRVHWTSQEQEYYTDKSILVNR